MSSPKPIVYFLCTGNSCRSQMAEGFARHLGPGRVEAVSAGIESHGLNPRAVQVMAEVGIDISQQVSKRIDGELLNRSDYVITLCGDARDTCPVTPASVVHMHWGLPDPARATGTEAEILATFRVVRDRIRDRVAKFLDDLAGQQDG